MTIKQGYLPEFIRFEICFFCTETEKLKNIFLKKEEESNKLLGYFIPFQQFMF